MMRCQLSTNVHNAASAGLLADASSFVWQCKDKFVTVARKALLLAAPAATALFELCMLALLDQTDDEAPRAFRLALKARLFKEDEQLLELELEARKEELALRYEECFERYSVVLATPRVRTVLSSTLLLQRPVGAGASSVAGTGPASSSSGSGNGNGNKRALLSPDCPGECQQESEKENDSDGPGAQLQTQRLKRDHGDQGSSGSYLGWCTQRGQLGAFPGDGSSDDAKE